jgi:hypothetical protein
MLQSLAFSAILFDKPAPRAGSVTDPSRKEPAQPFLIVIGGPRDGETLQLDSTGVEKLLGSGPDCHLRLAAGNVDAHHARVVWDEGRGVLLSDEASGSGTFVNGEAVGPEHRLQDGDRICLGPPGSQGSVKLLARVPAPPPLAHGLSDAGADFSNLLAQFPGGAAPDLVLEPPAAAFEEDVFDATEGGAAPAPAGPVPAPAKPPAAAEKHRAGREDLTHVPSIVVDTGRERPAVATPVTDAALQKLARQRMAKKGPPWRLVAIGGGLAVLVGLGLFLSRRFLSTGPPVLTAVLPSKVEPGGTLTLTGSGFETSRGRNTVRVGKVVAEVESASDTQLAVKIPATLGAVPAELPLTVETRGGRSNALFVKVRAMAQALSLEPDVALPGETVSLKGHQLVGKSLTLSVDDIPVDVEMVEPSLVRFKVPEMRLVEGRSINVRLRMGDEAARPLTLILGRLPLITELSPPKGSTGERVVIKGRGFDARPGGNLVTFGDEPALVVAASEQELVVAAPAQEDPQAHTALPVVVKALGRVSSTPVLFTQWRVSSGTFSPRFFAAAVPTDSSYDHVFVSSELGPALLLSDKDGAPSTAERAMRVAEGLNALCEEARSQPVRLELRPGHPPALAVEGKPAVLVRALAADAVGYGLPWEAGMSGQQTTPSELASFWAALLQDIVSLFVRHERPARLLEISVRGKPLLYLFAEGERRSGLGGGVPATLVNPPSPSLRRSLREMALLLPGKGESGAGAAVAGRWEGTMNERGVGERRIRLELRLKAGRLAGSLTSTVREISMEIILDGATYEKGVLTFAYSGGGGIRRFRGTLQGASIDGTIHGGDGQELGRFSLRFAG